MGSRTSASAGENRSVSFRIIERVASRRGVGYDELTPLAEAVDADALAGLVGSLGADGEIVFEYEGFVVTVTGEADVRLSRLS